MTATEPDLTEVEAWSVSGVELTIDSPTTLQRVREFIDLAAARLGEDVKIYPSEFGLRAIRYQGKSTPRVDLDNWK